MDSTTFRALVWLLIVLLAAAMLLNLGQLLP